MVIGMKKLTSKQIFTFVALACIIVVALVYFMVFKKYKDLAETTRANNAALTVRVADLKKYYDNEPTYLAEMEPMQTGVEEILAQYPADIREEDLIMHAVTTQSVTPVTYSSVNFGDKAVFKVVDAGTVQNAGMEKYQEQIQFTQYQVSYPNKLTYLGLKNLVQVIFDSEYNIGINRIAYTSDMATNELNGTLDLTFYSASGTGKEYTLPDMTPYESGVENIFGMENEEELIVETETE